MRKIILTASFLVATTAFAQKDELKTLKKMYDKEQLSTEDFAKYKDALVKLETVATTEDDKVASNFYSAMSPLVEMSTLGAQPTPAMIQKILNPEAFAKMVSGMRATLDYETKTGKKVFTTDINETITSLKPMFLQTALALNTAKKYNEASKVFYSVYTLDTKDVSNLENAAITAMNGADYVTAEKYYREIKTVGFKGTGIGKFGSKESEVAKNIASLAFFNKNDEQAKKDFIEAIALNPNDIPLQLDHAAIYYRNNDLATYKNLVEGILEKDPNNAQLQYNVGYLLLADDVKLVDEINANLKNAKKYEELNNKRKEMFKKALPYFEKAYQLDINNADTKTTLKLCYETLGMKDKAATIK